MLWERELFKIKKKISKAKLPKESHYYYTLSRQAGIPKQKQELLLFVILLGITGSSTTTTLLTRNKNQLVDKASPGIASLLKDDMFLFCFLSWIKSKTVRQFWVGICSFGRTLPISWRHDSINTYSNAHAPQTCAKTGADNTVRRILSQFQPMLLSSSNKSLLIQNSPLQAMN